MNTDDKLSITNPNVLSGTEGVKEVVPGVLLLPGQGNCLAVDLGDAIVLMDTGPGGRKTQTMIDALRAWSDSPVKAICYSHGHPGYNAGIPQWIEHANERGEASPRLIGHKNLHRRYERYRQTNGLQQKLNQSQFPQMTVPLDSVLVSPTDLYTDRFVITGSDRHVEVVHAPSETDDTTGLWIPDLGVLYGSAATIGASLPNIGTPLRTQRYTLRWAETLELFASLQPKYLVQEFGPVIEGEKQVHSVLIVVAQALRWLHEEVRVRMNRGMTATEIVHDIKPPSRLFDHPWMRETYGAVEYIVRDLYREENGWWEDRNPTSLHPDHPEVVAAVIADAITDKDSILAQARKLAEDGKTQAALHVVDLLAMAPGDRPEFAEARQLKADLCRDRAKEVSPYVSKALFETSALRYENGGILWTEKDVLETQAKDDA
jgi:glyoxylase-like metal-dependent hydrolase (beta-lactamase superfamily II)